MLRERKSGWEHEAAFQIVEKELDLPAWPRIPPWAGISWCRFRLSVTTRLRVRTSSPGEGSFVGQENLCADALGQNSTTPLPGRVIREIPGVEDCIRQLWGSNLHFQVLFICQHPTTFREICFRDCKLNQPKVWIPSSGIQGFQEPRITVCFSTTPTAGTAVYFPLN